MENLKSLLESEKKQIEKGGQIYFDSHGIYVFVSSTLEKMPNEKFYLEKFRQLKLHPSENGTFDLLGIGDLKWQKDKSYEWDKKEMAFIAKNNNSDIIIFTWILTGAFALLVWFLVVCGILFWM